MLRKIIRQLNYIIQFLFLQYFSVFLTEISQVFYGRISICLQGRTGFFIRRVKAACFKQSIQKYEKNHSFFHTAHRQILTLEGRPKAWTVLTAYDKIKNKIGKRKASVCLKKGKNLWTIWID